MTWNTQLPPQRRTGDLVRKLIVAIAALAILAAAWFAFRNSAPLPLNGRPVIAYKLRPRARNGLGQEGPGYFNLYMIEQTVGSVSPDLRSKLIDILSSSSSYVSNEDKKFDPVMGVSFGIGGDRTDVMYSPAFHKVWFSRGNQFAKRALSDKAVRELNSIYEEIFHEDPMAAYAPRAAPASTQ